MRAGGETLSKRQDASSQGLICVADRVLAPTYKRPDHLFSGGRGTVLETSEGKRYLDMTGGIGVLALGHRSTLVTDAIQEVASSLVHVSNLFHTSPPILLAEALVERSFADRVFFANSGAEAVEGAIKFARLAAGPERSTIVTFDGSFHGRTLGALAATDRPDYQEPFEPLATGFLQARFNDPAGLDVIDESVAAVLVEPIQGESGIHVADADWLRALRARCDEVGAALIFDEVQCGVGRTGYLWAHEWADVIPDLMTLAKPLAGGLPIGAVLMTEEVSRSIQPGCHGTTFGGGPLVTHVALSVLREVGSPEFLERVMASGRFLHGMLGRIPSPLIAEVRGRGLMLGVRVLVPPSEVVRRAEEEGLLLVAAGDDVIRFLPPLNIGEPEMGQAAVLFQIALERTAEELGR